MAKRKRGSVQDKNVMNKLVDRLTLSWRLLTDGRVNMGQKLIPLIAILYVLSPIDLLPEIVLGPFGVVDDIGIFIAMLEFFIRTSPSELVREHLSDLEGDDQGFGTGDVIDGDSKYKD